MVDRYVLDAEMIIELPRRDVMSLTLTGGAGIGARLGDIIQLFLLPLIPSPQVIPLPSPFVST